MKPGFHEERTGLRGIATMILPPLALTGIWYTLYYLLAPWIWSKNIPFRPEDITPWIRTSTVEHDGIEIYALYLLAFLNIASAFSLSVVIDRCAEKGRRIAVAISAVLSLLFCVRIGFIPPMNTLVDAPLSTVLTQSLAIIAVTLPPFALLWRLQRKPSPWGVALAALLLVPACFLSVSNFAWRDYTYIFAPAQRLLDGARLSDIYFQYDLLPSLLAAPWLKLGLDLNYFRVLGQIAYFLAILGVYLLSLKLFRRKDLSVFLLAALILGRMYASPFDATLTFQTTPIRLDLWLLLLLAVYRFGPYHWFTGLISGLLMILLKNFGIIYAAAYLQLLLTLWVVGYLDGEKREPLLRSLAEHGKRCAAPLLIVGVCGVTSHFLFHNAEYGDFAGYYRKIGIGFIQIARNSFYWYVLPLLSTAVILLFRLRKSISCTYMNTGFLLVYCAVGNSIYFFGRSHEHNILNIAIVLLFLFFFFLDLVDRALQADGGGEFSQTVRKRLVPGAAVLLLAVIIVSYSDNISLRGTIQFVNVANGKPFYTKSIVLPEGFYGYMGKIREATDNSSKVYFVDKEDFAFYFFGGYAPVGYCNPFLTWIFTKDLRNYLQKLLDDGYYLVFSPDMTWLLHDLKYHSKTLVGETIVVAMQASKP